jgi:hypothetical protein
MRGRSNESMILPNQDVEVVVIGSSDVLVKLASIEQQ